VISLRVQHTLQLGRDCGIIPASISNNAIGLALSWGNLKVDMSTRTQATIEDLYHVDEDGKAEIVDGELVLMSPTGDLPGSASVEIVVSLRDYARQTKLGRAYGDNVGFIVNLPNRRSFSPDAAFYIGPRTGGKFLDGAPIFAVEVRSEGDYGRRAEERMARKRADYFAAGTLVVWDVDVLREQVVRCYKSDDPETPRVFHCGEIADAEPALPGWTMPVDDLFV
jgi:Uma2 family endonuclease